MKQFKKQNAMKTKKTISALSLVLLFSGLISLYASSPSNMSSLPGSVLGIQKVTYIVKIDHNVDLAGFNCNYYIVISDESGKAVAAAQPFRMGQWSYVFQEYTNTAQTAHTRTATMTKDSHSICPDSYIFAPKSLNGPFDTMQTYTFVLIPEKAQPVGK